MTEELEDSSIIKLSKAKEGDRCTVIRIDTENEKKLQILLSMNILPGKSITVLQTFPSMIFQVGETEYAVDSSISEAIFVRTVGSNISQIVQNRKNDNLKRKIVKISSFDIIRKFVRLF